MWYETAANTTLNEAFNNQEQLQDEKTINSDEIFKRLVIDYSVDPSDVNTFDDQQKTVYEASSEILTSPGINYELVKRLKRVDLPFARGSRKGSLTFVEEAARVFCQAIDLFCGTSLAAQIDSRKDVMQISSQYFGVTKLLWMNGTKLHANQNNYIGADILAQNYWYSRFIENNQKERKKSMPLELTESEFFNFLNNNYVNLNNGSTAKITRVA